jgi:hypothetical protein
MQGEAGGHTIRSPRWSALRLSPIPEPNSNDDRSQRIFDGRCTGLSRRLAYPEQRFGANRHWMESPKSICSPATKI